MSFIRPLATVLTSLLTPMVAHAEGAPAPCPPFEVVGQGPDLVLVPGLGSSPAVWDGLRESLAKDYRLHLVHVAGFAGRDLAGDPEGLLARTRAEIIRHLDCKRVGRAAYASHSLGGFLGLTLVAEHPDRIARVVVIDSLPFFPLIFDPAATPELAAPQADALRTALLAQDDAGFAAGQRAGVTSLVRNAAFHETVAKWSIDSDRATFAGAIHALMITDMRPRLGEIAAPVDVIFATNAFAPRARVEPLFNAA
jgi:pimeloyl-[acyl-carrier protein] methyl ester esterase